MKKNRNYLILKFVLVFSLAALPAMADQTKTLTPEEQAKSDQLVNEAIEHYGAGRYEEAVECFKQAYDILGEPELLYNVARTLEKMAKSEEAIEWYEKFLLEPGTTGELRSKALSNITALRKEIAAQEALHKAEETPTEDAPRAPEDSTSDAESGSGATALDNETDIYSTEPTSDDTSHRLSPLRIVSYVAMGGGLAAIITGSVFGGLALADKKDYESAGDSPDRVGFRDDMERKALIFDIVFSSGAFLTTIGISLFVVDAVRQGSENDVSVGKRRGKNGRSAGAITVMPSFRVGKNGLSGGLMGHF